jgi:hypothetical protein
LTIHKKIYKNNEMLKYNMQYTLTMDTITITMLNTMQNETITMNTIIMNLKTITITMTYHNNNNSIHYYTVGFYNELTYIFIVGFVGHCRSL